MQAVTGKALVAEGKQLLAGFFQADRVRRLMLAILHQFLPLTVRLLSMQPCQLGSRSPPAELPGGLPGWARPACVLAMTGPCSAHALQPVRARSAPRPSVTRPAAASAAQAKDLHEWQDCPEDFVTRELEGAGFRDSLRPCAETLLACLFEARPQLLTGVPGPALWPAPEAEHSHMPGSPCVPLPALHQQQMHSPRQLCTSVPAACSAQQLQSALQLSEPPLLAGAQGCLGPPAGKGSAGG